MSSLGALKDPLLFSEGLNEKGHSYRILRYSQDVKKLASARIIVRGRAARRLQRRLYEGSVHAEIEGADCVIREYLLGAAALLQRLGIPHPAWEPLRVPWDQLDLTDPEHPRLRCSAAELAGR